MSDSDRTSRIVEARRRLRERFLDRMRQTPAVSDAAPQGKGPPNRHGMPQVPPGQVVTTKWPVLDLGVKPAVDRSSWRLRVDGHVEAPQELAWSDLLALEQVDDTSDFHCVTAWSRLDVPWRGVRLATVLALARPRDEARFLLCHGADGYTTNLPLEEALKDDVLLAHEADGRPLTPEHGGPVRIITPQLYAWKGAKWICRLELLAHDQPGFWEQRGYSNSAHPWRNDRYG